MVAEPLKSIVCQNKMGIFIHFSDVTVTLKPIARKDTNLTAPQSYFFQIVLLFYTWEMVYRLISLKSSIQMTMNLFVRECF